MRTAILITGNAGCGKTTLGNFLADTLNAARISTGDIARRLPNRDWEDQGKLAPEAAFRALFRKEISKPIHAKQDLFVIDGLPRTADQIEFARGIFDKILIIRVALSKKIAVHRLTERGRRDDTADIIKKRYREMEQKLGDIQEEAMALSGADSNIQYLRISNNTGIEDMYEDAINMIIIALPDI